MLVKKLGSRPVHLAVKLKCNSCEGLWDVDVFATMRLPDGELTENDLDIGKLNYILKHKKKAQCPHCQNISYRIFRIDFMKV
ncbi:MAG: hypothetical protein COU51_01285 [Parcubacteria group bacterium CG10_big_fil_rev_8_21_14_0_10_36_14]|nr:MAG: hypothetical protein COU51_01285 [Parcubacteria group bacterium CG10_big_fil_rev_8_21_14_0_10_36_14]